MRALLFTLTTLALLSGCATPMSTGSHCTVEPGYLDAENTFSWHNDPPITLHDETGYVSPAAVDILNQAVRNELAGKGFTLADEPAAAGGMRVTVAITLKTRREIYALDTAGSPCYHTDCWERIDFADPAKVDIRTVGFLSADVYADGKPIWRGWVERTLYPADRDSAGDVIRTAIPALFESFPP